VKPVRLLLIGAILGAVAMLTLIAGMTRSAEGVRWVDPDWRASP
jgi:hypothetical protein